VVAGLREERLHHAVKHDIPRQLHPGVIEGHEVRCATTPWTRRMPTISGWSRTYLVVLA
jgi:hypothetical protein